VGVAVAVLTAGSACTGGGGGTAGADAGTVSACGTAEPIPGPMPRAARLTHQQYANSVEDLLGVSITQAATFVQDSTFAGFDNNAAALSVNALLTNDYRRAAEEIAAQAVEDTTAFAALAPCDVATGDDTCARTLIRDLALRAYRRPLTTAEEDAHFTLYQRGRDLYDGPAFRNGMQLVIEALLQSPLFLYRIELSDRQDAEQLIALSGYEVASRLSFMLWNTLPDTMLLTAAASGALDMPIGIEAQARRMLDDPRAVDSIDDFHRQWLQYEKYEDLTKSQALYPNWSPAIGSSLVDETQRFIRHVILEAESNYAELLSASYAYVNDDLAAIYGVSGTFGTTFSATPVQLDPTERAGLLTQAGFLASHAYGNQDSPIHRGVFVQRQFLCVGLRPPSFQIDPNLPPLSPSIRTTRQQVEAHTAMPACQQCHGQINPSGFAFSGYDAIGAFRTTENGEPIDSTGSLLLDGREQSFEDAVDLAHMLADSQQSRRCYLTQWFQYANGRSTAPQDQCTIERLHSALQASNYNIKELLLALTQTRTFRYRAVEAVSP